MGIRSPNPRAIPELRTPDDLSPSPPFVPAADRSLKGRKRQPSPQRRPRLSVLNTIIPENSQTHEAHRQFENSSFSDTQHKYRKSVEFSNGQYEKIKDNSPLTLHKQSKPNFKDKKSYTMKNNDGYPDSDVEDDIEQCKDYGHSYYKPGGYTSYIPQNIFDRNNREKRQRSPKRRQRILYARVPTCDSMHEEINEVSHHKRTRSKQKVSLTPDRCLKSNIQGKYKVTTKPEMDSDTTSSNRQQNDRDSPPLASSSRNTSVDNSANLHEKNKASGCQNVCLRAHNHKSAAETANTHSNREDLPRVVRGPAHRSVGGYQNESEESSASVLPIRVRI